MSVLVWGGMLKINAASFPRNTLVPDLSFRSGQIDGGRCGIQQVSCYVEPLHCPSTMHPPHTPIHQARRMYPKTPRSLLGVLQYHYRPESCSNSWEALKSPSPDLTQHPAQAQQPQRHDLPLAAPAHFRARGSNTDLCRHQLDHSGSFAMLLPSRPGLAARGSNFSSSRCQMS